MSEASGFCWYQSKFSWHKKSSHKRNRWYVISMVITSPLYVLCILWLWNVISIYFICFFSLVFAISCKNHSTTLVVFRSRVWSKTINLPNMSLKDSPGTCIAIEEGFVLFCITVINVQIQSIILNAITIKTTFVNAIHYPLNYLGFQHH